MGLYFVGSVPFRGIFWIRAVFHLSSIQVSQFSVCIYSFLSQVCHVWRCFLNQNLCMPSSPGVFQFAFFVSVFLTSSECMFTWGPSASIINSVSMLFIHSAFLWSFRSHILLQNLLASLPPGCWYGFAHSPQIVVLFVIQVWVPTRVLTFCLWPSRVTRFFTD